MQGTINSQSMRLEGIREQGVVMIVVCRYSLYTCQAADDGFGFAQAQATIQERM